MSLSFDLLHNKCLNCTHACKIINITFAKIKKVKEAERK